MYVPFRLLFPLALLCSLASARHSQEFAIRNVNVIPMNEEVLLENHTVLVIDGVIEAIEPDDALILPEGVHMVDGLGGYLYPGLHDTHTHPKSVDDLLLFVANGVTCVWVLNADEDMLEWKQTAQPAPTLRLFAGPISNYSDGDRLAARANELANAGFDRSNPPIDGCRHDAAGVAGAFAAWVEAG